MATNSELVGKLYRLTELVVGSNMKLVRDVNRAAVHLLEYDGDLANASREDLLKIRGITTSSVEYVRRVFAGENIEEIAREPVPWKKS